MIERIRNWFQPMKTYRFWLIDPRTREKLEARIEARTEYAAIVGIRWQVDTGRWLIGPPELVEG